MKRVGEAFTRRIVRDRANGLCERCGKAGTTIHHRKKRSQGGPWTPENCVALCGDGTRGCHGWVEHNPTAAHAEGFHVRPWEDENVRQILHREWGWCWLDSEHYTLDEVWAFRDRGVRDVG